MTPLGQATIGPVMARLKALGATVDVTVGATTVTGLMNHEAQQLFADGLPGLTGDEKAVLIPAGVAGLVNGAALTVGGTPYRAKVLPVPDEAFVLVVLLK